MGSDDENNGFETEWSCCNDTQSVFLVLYVAFVGIALITWRTVLAKPMRLIAVFVHEWCHAVACWLTCGSVHSIEVYENEGGVTRYRGGCRCLIIPAGYVGCALWAMVLVIMSGGRKLATFAAIVFSVSLFGTLFTSPNSLLVYLSMGYCVVTIIVILIEWWVYTPILQYLVLFYGVTVGMFAIADIYADTVVRNIQGSDSYACSKEVCVCCPGRCIGMQWAILAILFQWLGIWIALVQMSDECDDLGWFQCTHLSVGENLGEFWEETWDGERNWEFDGFWWQEAH